MSPGPSRDSSVLTASEELSDYFFPSSFSSKDISPPIIEVKSSTMVLSTTQSVYGPPSVLVPPKQQYQLAMKDDGSNSVFIKPVRNKSLHPLGLRDYIPEGSAVAGSHNRDEFWDRTLGDSRVYILNSVQPSTMDQYKVGVKHFFDFIVIFGTNRLLTRRPAQWYRNPHLQEFTFMETVAMSYLAYLASDPAVEPKTAIAYLSAVRKYWINCNMNVLELDTSQAIKAQRAGMVNLWRAKEGNKESDRMTLPMGVDMIQYMSEVMFPNYRTGPLIEHAVCVSAKVGYSLVARQCEYLYTPNAKVHHHLRARDGMQWTVFKDGKEILIGADQVGPYTLDDISMLYATINCAKNDTGGHGHRMPFPKLDLEVDTEAAFCLCTETFLLAKRLKLKPHSPFFSSPSDQENWALTAEVLNYYLRKAASEGFQIHSNKISSRSLRIGAASAMASANLPDYAIQKVGRWKSLVFLQYIRLARGAFKSAQAALMNRNNFTVNDVRMWHPGSRHLLENIVPEDYPDDATDDSTVVSAN